MKNLKYVEFYKTEQDIKVYLEKQKEKNIFMYSIGISYLALELKINGNLSNLDSIEEKTTKIFLDEIKRKHNDKIVDVSDKNTLDELYSLIMNLENMHYSRMTHIDTPLGIAKLGAKLLDIQNDDVVFDFGSGYGTLLNYISEEYNCKNLYGMEINSNNIIIANIRAFILEHKINFIQEDILTANVLDYGTNKIFSFPPIGIKLSLDDHNIKDNPKFKKYLKDEKNTTSASWIFTISALENLNRNGKAAILLPNSVMGNLSEENIRKKLIENKVIEAVIQLPADLLQYTSIPVTLIILSEENESVNMIDASEIYTKNRRKNILEEVDINKIMEAYNKESEISRSVSYDEIEKNNYILNPQRYMKSNLLEFSGILLGEVASKISRGTMIKSSELDLISTNEETDYSFIKLQNIKDGIVDEELQYLTEINDNYDKYCIKTNNLLISKISPFKVATIKIDESKKILANGNLYFLEIDEAKINPKFVEAYLQSESGIAQLNLLAKGEIIKNISIQDLKLIKIPNFDMSKQKEIAENFISLNEELELISKKKEQIKVKKDNLFEDLI